MAPWFGSWFWMKRGRADRSVVCSSPIYCFPQLPELPEPEPEPQPEPLSPPQVAEAVTVAVAVTLQWEVSTDEL